MRICAYDLRAVNARYHLNCYAKFKAYSGESMGRPVKSEGAFEILCKFIRESDECQFSINELQAKLKEFAATDENVYSNIHLKRLISQHYGENVILTTKHKQAVFSFRDSLQDVLTDSWYTKRQQSNVKERDRIIEAAVAIIRQDIQSQVYEIDEYPSYDCIERGGDDLVPESLRMFTDLLTSRRNQHQTAELDVKLKRKRLFINHSIIAMCRPRSFISPLRLALSLYLNRKFASRNLIDCLFNLGM